MSGKSFVIQTECEGVGRRGLVSASVMEFYFIIGVVEDVCQEVATRLACLEAEFKESGAVAACPGGWACAGVRLVVDPASVQVRAVSTDVSLDGSLRTLRCKARAIVAIAPSDQTDRIGPIFDAAVQVAQRELGVLGVVGLARLAVSWHGMAEQVRVLKPGEGSEKDT
ncbi:hypothetical protein [Fusarium redolens polymycovirus 1]|uniref:Uncharacterized protein n=1 Tax=Fusarium redolens polymycovirus 1 TaxID=2546034 RepID=A0A513ZVE0_9VIRU|nr:hypothetical protein KM555_s7gp1 [Fusarium redolens polymycovirus 1]QDH44662.1 hypothetical protein [Fusarium redolens polymycovirus 1]